MRTIPRALGPDDRPPSMMVPSVSPHSDVDPAAFSEASGQRGVSSIAGLPVEIPTIRPTMSPSDVGVDRGYVRQAQDFGVRDRQPVQPVQPVQQIQEIHTIPESVRNQLPPRPSVAEAERMGLASANWRPICRGVVEDARLDRDGGMVVVRSSDGRRFVAYIGDLPVIEIGISVEMGVRSIRNTTTDDISTVADIIPLEGR